MVEVEQKVSKKGWVPIIVRVETHEKLEGLREKMGLRSFNDVIARLIDFYEKSA